MPSLDFWGKNPGRITLSCPSHANCSKNLAHGSARIIVGTPAYRLDLPSSCYEQQDVDGQGRNQSAAQASHVSWLESTSDIEVGVIPERVNLRELVSSPLKDAIGGSQLLRDL